MKAKRLFGKSPEEEAKDLLIEKQIKEFLEKQVKSLNKHIKNKNKVANSITTLINSIEL